MSPIAIHPAVEAPESGVPLLLGAERGGGVNALRATCFHCGEPCRNRDIAREDKVFCCHGCLLVHDLLAEHGMEGFYDLSTHPGAKVRKTSSEAEFAYLDDPKLQRQLLDFTDGRSSRVTLQIPAIHCVACVWLLENLFRLKEGIGRSTVNFGKREVSVWFDPAQLRLSQLAAFLTSMGYEPSLTLDQAARPAEDPARKRLWLRLGVAGFAFGNIMLFSLPGYLGLDSASGPVFQQAFGYLSLALALPVVIFSAGDYWRSALLSMRQRALTLDVPIALGLAALYLQSAGEIIPGRGEGYLDSLAALVFLLLCGRMFQQKTFERIAFDRDYRSFFPLCATRKTAAGEESIALAEVRVGDRLAVRNGEMIPADARLLEGGAAIDYSFVTGESEPVLKLPGDYLYAGGRHQGAAIEVETLKPVSQSYLTSLWNDEVFQKPSDRALQSLTNRYSRRFTWIVLAIALGAAAFWALSGNPATAVKAFASVLIVACPCALALAAPFTFGAAQRELARGSIFVKGPLVLEGMAGIDTVVFDKTGTLTVPGGCVTFKAGEGVAGELSAEEESWIGTLASHSTHPYSRSIARLAEAGALEVRQFEEREGAGTSAMIDGHAVRLGSQEWLEAGGAKAVRAGAGSVLLGIDGKFRGEFQIQSAVREEAAGLLESLRPQARTYLLSGDTEREREAFAGLFGGAVHFNQSPAGKLAFIRKLQAQGAKVMMVGDGLNDAGALKQSDVGVAVVERTGAFSPASDVVLPAARVGRLGDALELARRATRIVKWGFGISAVYNAAGIAVAAAGILSPLICAVLMPLSSVSVVLFACGATRRAARRLGLEKGGAPA